MLEDSPRRKRWTRHGSTRYIFTEGYLRSATNYVLNKQGVPMEWNAIPMKSRDRQGAGSGLRRAATVRERGP